MGSSTSHTKKDTQVIIDTSDIQDDIAAFELSICGRVRIYPREPSQTITIATAGGADAYGN